MSSTRTSPTGFPRVALCDIPGGVNGISSFSVDGVAVVSSGSLELFAGFFADLGVETVAVRGRALPTGRTAAAGTVLVATEVGSEDWSVPCPSAPILFGELRRRGVAARLVRVVTEHVEGSDPDGAVVAVSSQSAELFRLAAETGGAFAFVCDVHVNEAGVDHTPVLEALRAWGSAVGRRHVLLAGPRSFCAGVERAIEIVERVLAQCGAPVYVRKQIVHNLHVVRDLEQRGAVFVDELDEVPPDSTVIFSAHGVSPAVKDEAMARHLRVIDATCPLVTKVHTEAKRFAQRGDTIVLIGHSGHEESEGTLGEAPDRMVLVETPDDVERLEIDGPVSYLMQTTLAVDEAENVVAALRKRFPQLVGPQTDDICYATTNRQDALRAVAADADLVLVVGSTNSSNSLRLVELAKRNGTEAFLIDDVTDLDPSWLVGVKTVGLTAGASAPPKLVAEVIDALAGFGEVTVAERQVAQETIHFGLPKEVQRTHAAPADGVLIPEA